VFFWVFRVVQKPFMWFFSAFRRSGEAQKVLYSNFPQFSRAFSQMVVMEIPGFHKLEREFLTPAGKQEQRT